MAATASASSAAVQAYDPATLAWTAKASLPGARNAMSVGAVDGQIVATGGWAAAGPRPTRGSTTRRATRGRAAADAPVSLSASGQAVADGKLYVVGGCTTAACTPMSNDVAAYDPATDSWEQLADYPAAVAFASCGGIDGMVYCTGGNDGSAATGGQLRLRPGGRLAGPRSRTRRSTRGPARTPWPTARSSSTAASRARTITNATFAYDPASDAWADLPNSNTARYRGGMACGLYKIGGSSGGFTATVDSEMLPGFEDCGSSGCRRRVDEPEPDVRHRWRPVTRSRSG